MAASANKPPAGPGTRTRWGVISGEHDTKYWDAEDGNGRPILVARDLGHALGPNGANIDWLYGQLDELKGLLRASGQKAGDAERYWTQHPTAIRGRIEAELRARAQREAPAPAPAARAAGRPAAQPVPPSPPPAPPPPATGIPSWLRVLLAGVAVGVHPQATDAAASTRVVAPDARAVRPGALRRLGTDERAALRKALGDRGIDFAAWQRQASSRALGAVALRALARFGRGRVGRG